MSNKKEKYDLFRRSDKEIMRIEQDLRFEKRKAARRDYFAAAALTGIIANPNSANCGYSVYAKEAIGYADAMIKELNKRK